MNAAQPSRNQIKKPITCTCTSTTTCTYFVDVDVHVLVDACCHLQICFQKVKDFRPSNTVRPAATKNLAILCVFVVKGWAQATTKTRSVFDQWKNSFQLVRVRGGAGPGSLRGR